MYCPQCGQQQVSDEVRFCPRCGFQLGSVTGLLATGGILPAYEAENAGPDQQTPRRKGIRQGTLMMLIGMVLTPVLAVILSNLGGPFEPLFILVPISAIVFIWGGILRMLYARVFQEGAPRKREQEAPLQYVPPAPAPKQLDPAVRGAPGLPPAQSIPARSFMPRGDTAEIVPPPSVTENTTRLLDEQMDKNKS
jgi:hypothetical protein